jgi:hypothetical protein
VSQEVRQVAGNQVGVMITQLHTSGAQCWQCGKEIRRSHPAALVMQLTSIGVRAGFVHAKCGCSQVVDLRTNRTASLKTEDWFRGASTEVQAFVAVRDYPAPRALVVVSSESPVWLLDSDESESLSWLTTQALERGMVPVAPPLLDSAPPPGANWAVKFSASSEHLTVQTDDQCLYDGSADHLEDWCVAVRTERKCVVFCSQVGVRSNLLEGATLATLDAFARRGFVAGVTASASVEPEACARSAKAEMSGWQ